MSNASRGSAFERRCARYLEGLGYLVTRSAGSHGSADLVANRAGQTLLVQAKISGRLDPEAWDALVSDAQQAGAWAVLVSRGPKPRCELRWKLLIDRKLRGRHMASQPALAFDPQHPPALPASEVSTGLSA